VTTISVFVSLTMVAPIVPKSTAVAFASARPVMVTVVPPAVDPVAEATALTCGMAGARSKEVIVEGSLPPSLSVASLPPA
jgi:hypothetical protein